MLRRGAFAAAAALRVSIAFGGFLRLGSTASLFWLGAQGACYPPTNLHFGSSVLVCTSYVVLAAALPPGCCC